MRSSSLRLALIVVIFLAALVGGLLLMRESAPEGSKSADSPDPIPAGEIWQVGDEWTVQVKQDAGAVAPDSTKNVAKIPFTFTVLRAPDEKDEPWVVKVVQEGAEGPFAAGWRLHYKERESALVLTHVAIGSDTPLEAELAAIVLGSQFPYEVRYTAPPKDSTVTAEDLIERASLPPAAVPGSDGDAGPKGAPTAPPIEDAVAPGTAPAAPKR